MPPPSTPTLQLFAVCPPGLEPLLSLELQSVGIEQTTRERGGVSWTGDQDSLYTANLRVGLASQVLIRVASFGARSLAELDKRGARIDWCTWLRAGTPTAVKANCRRSRIYHSGAAAERIAKHLTDQLGPSLEGGAVPIRVRIQDNTCTISLDSSGEPLYRRGWRLDPGGAPLREDLARALLIASGWDRRSTVIDPMSGSGTILIEAASMARGLAPGRLRTFAVEQFAMHDAERLERIRRQTGEAALSTLEFQLFGSDRDENVLRASRANAERAGVLADLELRAAPLGAALDHVPELPPRGALISNPPYGKRMGDKESLGNLYQSLGVFARRLPPEWTTTLAAADRRLALRTGLSLSTAFLAESGGLKIRGLTTSPIRTE